MFGAGGALWAGGGLAGATTAADAEMGKHA